MKACLAIYSHPELFPPTLNAIDFFSNNGWEVDVIYNNQFASEWNFSKNVSLFPVGQMKSQKILEKKHVVLKIFRWLRFSFQIFRKIHECDVYVAYDPIPLLSYYIVSVIRPKKTRLLWYHNHDVFEIQNARKYSIQWLSIIAEKKMFNKIDVFSLPAEERKTCFPMKTLKGAYFFVPNYPSLFFYGKFRKQDNLSNKVKLLFQGNISPNHGIEEIISLLPLSINGKEIELILKGHISLEYKELVVQLASQRGAEQCLIFVGQTPYHEVINTTIDCSIGLAIFTANDIMNKTLGTASNKIYEYAACGLPIIYYNNEHFRNHLGKYEWAFSTDLSQESLVLTLEHILCNYENLSDCAKSDFETQLNFEQYFSPAFNYVESIIE